MRKKLLRRITLGFTTFILAGGFTALIVANAPQAFAQQIAPTGEYKEGLPVNGWMLYPSIFFGAVYDSNSNQANSSAQEDSGWSARVVPRLTATVDRGLSKTTVYGLLDASFFDANTVAARAGFSHNYQPNEGVTFNVYGDYTRETDVFSNAAMFNNGAIGPPNTPNNIIPLTYSPFGSSPYVNPIAYNQFTAGASVTKNFNEKWFGGLGVTGTYIAYDKQDDIPDPFHTSHDAGTLWVTGRIGYRFVPTAYVFAQVDGTFYRYDNSVFNTNGYRVIGGIGTADRNSLWAGEIYGGYWSQDAEHSIGVGILGDTNTPVFGGRIYYYPTRYWTFIASVDQALGNSSYLAVGVPQGVASMTTTALLQTTYGISRQWSIGGRLGYTRADWKGPAILSLDRTDNGWMAGASLNYEMWRNLLLTLDYQYTTVDSSAPFSDFNRNVFTAGATYKY